MGFDHEAIARDFREYRSGGNGQAQAVTFDHHPLLDGDIGEPNGIEDEEIGGGANLEKGLFHRSASGLPDIDRIDNLGVHDPYSKAERHVTDQFIKSLALPFVQPLRVTKPHQRAAVTRKDHGGRDDRACQRSASHLIQTGDAPKPPGPRLAFEDLVRRQWHEVKLRAGRHFVRCRGGGRGILFDFAFREIFALGDPRHLALLRSQVIQLGPANAALAHHIHSLDHG